MKIVFEYMFFHRCEEFVQCCFKNVLSVALSEPQLTENTDCSNCQRLVDAIKEKLTGCSNQRKIQMLTLAPEDWQSKKQSSFSMSVNMQ